VDVVSICMRRACLSNMQVFAEIIRLRALNAVLKQGPKAAVTCVPRAQVSGRALAHIDTDS